MQNRKPSGTVLLENMLHGDQERILTTAALPEGCRPAYSMSFRIVYPSVCGQVH